MKKFNNNSGFTLIEIIIVLIIVGVLAAIALPNLYSNIAKSKGAEAIASMGPMKSVLEGCGMKSGINYSGCTTQTLGSSGNFYYQLGSDCTIANAPNTGWCIRASYGTSSDANNYITLSHASTSAAILCNGYGTYGGIC
ncbi:MAG: prepilin-type N-terminal cleavage/methylation domain-containing protein [Candidatus Omnitrophica bacterium]|nr:prepilin-type N-terminal cleavage/methylation domain-containing protein [Candidatus Omnitrophota bacterium]